LAVLSTVNVNLWQFENYKESQIQSYFATDGRSFSQSWCRSPLGLMTRFWL